MRTWYIVPVICLVLMMPAVEAVSPPPDPGAPPHDTWVWAVDTAHDLWICVVAAGSGGTCVSAVAAGDDIYYVLATTQLGKSGVWHESNGCVGLQTHRSACNGFPTEPDERVV